MACAKDERHRFGQHYTPDNVARALAALAIRDAEDLVFDPSCGDGRLLFAALERKLGLSRVRPGASRAQRLSAKLFGIDRSSQAIDKARTSGANLVKCDFFHFNGGGTFPSIFDAIIGNPPYIRQEVMTPYDKRRVARLLEEDRRSLPDVV